MSVNIHIAGRNSLSCPVGRTVEEVRNEIRSGYRLEGGFLTKNGVMMFSNDVITSDGDYHFVNYQEHHESGISIHDLEMIMYK